AHNQFVKNRGCSLDDIQMPQRHRVKAAGVDGSFHGSHTPAVQGQSFSISAQTGTGLDQLMGVLEGKISAFTGNSGVGKSSVLNALCPPARQGYSPPRQP